jgi:hypothetical protein
MPAKASPARTLGGVLICFGVFMSSSGIFRDAHYLTAAGVAMIVTGVLLTLTLKLALVVHPVACAIAIAGYLAARNSGQERLTGW